MNKRQDVLVINVDCARASDFSVLGQDAQLFPNLRDLAEHGTTYLRAVSPANWTLPSHVSMFTGQFPWEHGAISYDSLVPDGSPTLAEIALTSGYKTASFSANPYVSDSTHLTRGFESAVWGRIEECAFRGCTTILPPRGRAGPLSGLRSFRERSGRLSSDGLTALLNGVVRLSSAIPDVFSRIRERFRAEDEADDPHVSPWIEDYLEQWVRMIPRDTPAFCFVNLLDAHEPYIGLSPNKLSLLELARTWTYHRVGSHTPQLGYDLPPEEVRRTLHDLYRFTIHIIDERVGTILSDFEKYRNSENLLVVVTSDHGQAFGEGGLMYHGFGTDDAVLRVPLIIMARRDGVKRRVVPNWVSTTGIHRFVRQVLSLPEGPTPELLGEPGLSSGESAPVWSLGSRAPGVTLDTKKEGRVEYGQEPLVVGYCDQYKLVMNPVTKEAKVLETGPSGLLATVEPTGGEMARLLLRGREIGKRLCQLPAVLGSSVSVRLNGWGYS